MEILITNIDNKKRIESSLKRIFHKIKDKTLITEIKEYPVIITDENDALKIYNKKEYTPNDKAFIKGLNEGPGAVISIPYENGTKHLVAINLKNNDELRFGDKELDGVISHELGHVFNKYKSKSLRSIIEAFGLTIKNPDQTITNVYKLNNQLNDQNNFYKEFYADYFSKKTNCSKGLIRSIELAISSNKFQDKNEMFKERLLKLRSNEMFENILIINL